MQLLHDEAVFHRPHHDEVLLAARRVFADGDAARVDEHLREQLVGARAALVGAEVIDLVEIAPLDLLGLQEFRDVDRVRGRGLERFELLGLEQHVLILGELVALDDLLARHDFAASRRDQLLLDARAVLLVDLIEGEGGLRLRG